MVNTMIMEIENFTDIYIFSLRSWSQVMVFILVFRYSIYHDEVSSYTSSS